MPKQRQKSSQDLIDVNLHSLLFFGIFPFTQLELLFILRVLFDANKTI